MLDVAKVRRLQTRVGVAVDGEFGPNTLDATLAALNVAIVVEPAAPRASDPPWIVEARRLIGTREIVGPQHNPWIVNAWARLGAKWFNDDETPWCGLFVANCLHAAGLAVPGGGAFARALAWKDWGRPCAPRLGAVGVKARQGGGHVFFIVGETADRRFFKALGGNQSNMVSIVDIPKSAVVAMRWPADAPPPADTPLPILQPGTISRSEA